MKSFRKAFTLVEIMAATLIMTVIVLSVLIVTTQILGTWNSTSGQLKNYFNASIVGNIIQEDMESLLIKRDGRAWLQVAYPENVGMLTGSNYYDSVPLKPPEIMFYSPTMLRPRYTRDQLSAASQDGGKFAVPIPGSVCAIKYQLSVKSPFLESASDESQNENQYNAFYGFYRAVIDPRSTVLEAMGQTIQGYTSDIESDSYRYALSNNLWNKTCTIIDEQGVEQPGRDLRTWVLSPENLLVMNVVDIRVTFGVFYPNPNSGVNEPRYKTAYIPPGTPFTVGRKILSPVAFGYGAGGTRESVDPTLVEEGFLAFADFSMTFISDEGAKEMRAKMTAKTLTQEEFKQLVLQYGNTVTRRVQFIAEPID